MNATTLTHAARRPAISRPDRPGRQGSASPERPTLGETLVETAPLFGAPAFFGPPITVVLGPWLLLVLVLVGPFALILTFLLFLAVVVCLLAVLLAVLASPYLLIRRVRAHGIVHAGVGDRRASSVVGTGRQVESGYVHTTLGNEKLRESDLITDGGHA